MSKTNPLDALGINPTNTIVIERRVIVAEVGDVGGADVEIRSLIEAAAVLGMRAMAEYLTNADSFDTVAFEYGPHEFTLSAAPLRDDVRDRTGAH